MLSDFEQAKLIAEREEQAGKQLYRGNPKNFYLVPIVIYDNLGAAELKVWIAMAKFVDKNGICWAKIPTLSKETALSKPVVTNCTKSLVRKGLMKKIRRGQGQSNVYVLYNPEHVLQARSKDF